MLKKLRKNYRRLVAFMLTVAMTFTNVGMNLNVAFAAGEDESALFLLSGAELQEAVQEAVESGETFDFASLSLKAKSTTLLNSYKKLLGGDGSKVYELDVPVDASYAPDHTGLQVFYNADTDDVVFLFTNESDMVVTFRANVDGYETARVTVNPNSANVEDGDADQKFTEDYSNSTMIDDEKETAGGIVLNPSDGAEVPTESEVGPGMTDPTDETETSGEAGPDVTDPTDETDGESIDESISTGETGSEGETDSVEESGAEESDAAESSPALETEKTEETDAAESTDESSAEAPAPEAAPETDEVQSESEEEIEAEPEAEIPDENTDASAAEGGLAALSFHKVARVATGVTTLDDDIPAEGDALIEDEEESEEGSETTTTAEAEDESKSETIEETTTAEETLPTSKENETDATDPTDEIKPDETLAPAPTESTDETKESEPTDPTESTEDIVDESTDPTTESGTDETTAPTDETTAAGETTAPADGEIADESKAPAVEDEGQMLEDDSIQVIAELDGKEFNTVTIWDSVNARAYKVALADIPAVETDNIATEVEYGISYHINPAEGASIEGADMVAAGEDLYFAVVPEEGYEIVAVTANGIELGSVEAVEETEYAGYTDVYMIPAVDITEDVEVQVYLKDLLAVPFIINKTVDGVRINITAPSEALPEGTSVTIVPVSAEAAIEKINSQLVEDGKEVVDAVAFDITFRDANGNEIQPGQSVKVTFSGVETKGEEAAVCHIDDEGKAEIVKDKVSPDKKNVEFEAEQFSEYVYYGIAPLAAIASYEVEVGGDKAISGTSGGYNHSWTSSDETIAIVEESRYSGRATITGVNVGGPVTITHTWTQYGVGNKSETFTVTVVASTQSYPLYCYTLVPGKTINSAGSANSVWNGMGVGSISGLKAPGNYQANVNLMGKGESIVYPDSYPDITVDGKRYQYAAADSPNATKAGYYTVEWIRIVQSDGANAGANGYNPVVGSGTPTFHLDGQIFINEENLFNVTFRIQEPGDNTFTIQENYSRLLPSGAREADLQKPSTPDKTYENEQYVFDGWYYDSACTRKVDFRGTITSNVNYYGKYVLKNKRNVTVTAKSDTVTYNGTTQTVSGFLNETADGIKVIVNGQDYYVQGLTATASGKDAGEYTTTISGKDQLVVKDTSGRDVTKQFTVETINGSLTIDKRELTLTSATDSKEYDGTPLTNDAVTVSVDGFAGNEGATYSVTGSQTVVGSSKNFFEYTLSAGTKAENYNITKTEGTLTVTTRGAKYEITVEANSGTWKYDGNEKSVSGFKTLEFAVNGQTYTVSGLTAEAKRTDAGDSAVNVIGTPVVKDASGNDVSAEFAVKTVDGTLTIMKRDVTLTSGSGSKEYDGTPLTNDAVTVSVDGFAGN
ncbi:MAG: hypothetical protein Q4F28_15580, partial [Eubacteriales bacterium]|nr:hypothetical protein [Eubacteriales bacterium]